MSNSVVKHLFFSFTPNQAPYCPSFAYIHNPGLIWKQTGISIPCRIEPPLITVLLFFITVSLRCDTTTATILCQPKGACRPGDMVFASGWYCSCLTGDMPPKAELKVGIFFVLPFQRNVNKKSLKCTFTHRFLRLYLQNLKKLLTEHFLEFVKLTLDH